MIKILGAAVTLSILLAACGNGDSSGSSKNYSFAIEGKDRAKTSLGAVWDSACIAGDPTQDELAHVDTYIFYSDAIYMDSMHFLNPDCSKLAYEISGFVNSVPIANPNDASEFVLNYSSSSLSSFTVAPLTTEVANGFNKLQLCGISNWVSSGARSILGTSCADQVVPAGETMKTTYTVSADGQTLQDLTCREGGKIGENCDAVQTFTRNEQETNGLPQEQ